LGSNQWRWHEARRQGEDRSLGCSTDCWFSSQATASPGDTRASRPLASRCSFPLQPGTTRSIRREPPLVQHRHEPTSAACNRQANSRESRDRMYEVAGFDNRWSLWPHQRRHVTAAAFD
jgi:hypothetical protein